MGKRLGRKRLYALEKMGQSLGTASAPGRGISGSVGTRALHRNGYEVMTEIYIDLGTTNGAAPSVVGMNNTIIGVSGSARGTLDTGSAANGGTASLNPAAIMQVKSAVHGKVQFVEMHCVEAPTASAGSHANACLDIDLRYASYATGAISGTAAGGEIIPGGGAWVEGESIEAFIDDNSLEDQYLYLTLGGNARGTGEVVTYSAGKYLIRLFGNITPKDLTADNKTGE